MAGELAGLGLAGDTRLGLAPRLLLLLRGLLDGLVEQRLDVLEAIRGMLAQLAAGRQDMLDMRQVGIDLTGRLPAQQGRDGRQGRFMILLQGEELLTHQMLEVGQLDARLEFGARGAQPLEVALVSRRGPTQHMDHRAHDRLVAAALGGSAMYLITATLDEAAMLRLGPRTTAMRMGVTAQADHRLQHRLAIEVEEETLAATVAQIAPRIQAARDLVGEDTLDRAEDVVLVNRMAVGADLVGQHRNRGHQRIAIGKQTVAHAVGVHAPHPLGGLRGRQATDPGLHKQAVEAQIDLGDPRHRREAGVVLGVMLNLLVELLDGARRELEQVVALDQLGIFTLGGTGDGGLIEAGRQDVDVVHVGGELGVLLAGDAAGHEDAEMAGGVMDAIDDGLLVGDHVLNPFVEVAHPAQGLRRRRDVIAARAEHHYRGAHVAQVDAAAVRGHQLGGGEPVADEQVVDDVLDLVTAEDHMPPPPALELQVALGFGVDLGVEPVLLGPPGIGRIQSLEVLDQPSAIEEAGAQVAEQRGHPAAAGQPAGVAHRRLAVLARPVGERCAGDEKRTEELRLQGGGHHDLPAGLAVADHHRLLGGLRMPLDDVAKEGDFGLDHVLDGLALHRVGQKADEIAGMPGAQRHADFAIRLEATDAGAVPGARVHHHEGAHLQVGLDPRGRLDAQQLVVDRTGQVAPIHQYLGVEAQHVGLGLLDMLEVLVAALAHDIHEEHAALQGVAPVVAGGTSETERIHEGQHAGWRSRYQGIHFSAPGLLGAGQSRCRCIKSGFVAVQYSVCGALRRARDATLLSAFQVLCLRIARAACT